MLRFQASEDDRSLKVKSRHRRGNRLSAAKSDTSVKSNPDNFVDVDVGTPSLLRVILDNAAAFRVMHQSPYSRLFQIKRRDGNTEVLVVRWMNPVSAYTDRDHIAISLVPNKLIAPEYEGKESFVHQGTYVSIGVRRYIEGKPLSAVMKRATREQMDHYKLQISSMVRELAEAASAQYGSVLDGNLKTSTVTGYIACHNMLEKVKDRNYKPSQVTSGPHDWSNTCKPRLCHGSLWPDHIIVNGTSVEGFVGWSSCDFVPESIDRYMYYLWYVRPRLEQQWRQFLCSVPCVEKVSKTPAADRDMIEYAQSVAVSRAGKSGKEKVTALAQGMMHDTVEFDCTDNGLTCDSSRASVAETISDKKSLSALTDETIDTWENFTVATDTTVR